MKNNKCLVYINRTLHWCNYQWNVRRPIVKEIDMYHFAPAAVLQNKNNFVVIKTENQNSKQKNKIFPRIFLIV